MVINPFIKLKKTSTITVNSTPRGSTLTRSLLVQVWPTVLITFLVAVTQYLIRSNACRRVPEGTAYSARKAWQRVQETTLDVQSGSRMENAGHHRPAPSWSDCGCHWPSVGHLLPHLTQTRNMPRAFWDEPRPYQVDNDY